MVMPTLAIVRGLPGSGKSTCAMTLAASTGAVLIEPDAFLMHAGTYDYTPARYMRAKHLAWNLAAAAGSIGADVIYVDVLPTKSDIDNVVRFYTDDRGTANIRVFDMPLLTVEESMARNRHAVRREDIERMAREWEPWEASGLHVIDASLLQSREPHNSADLYLCDVCGATFEEWEKFLFHKQEVCREA